MGDKNPKDRKKLSQDKKDKKKPPIPVIPQEVK